MAVEARSLNPAGSRGYGKNFIAGHCARHRVIVLGEDMRARIIAKGVEPSRVLIVRDGTEILPRNTPLPTPDPEVVSAIRGSFSFVLVHAGNLGFYGA